MNSVCHLPEQGVANSTGHAFRVGGRTYYKRLFGIYISRAFRSPAGAFSTRLTRRRSRYVSLGGGKISRPEQKIASDAKSKQPINHNNMKKILIISLLLTFIYMLTCCSAVKESLVSGNYRSDCMITGVPELEVEFNNDHTFIYKHGHSPYTILGRWQVKKDTLFLYAEEFEIETVSFEEAVDFIISNLDATDFPSIFNGQYTSAEDCDIYLIRGRKLLPMQEDGSFSKESCVLEKLKKDDIPIWRRQD